MAVIWICFQRALRKSVNSIIWLTFSFKFEFMQGIAKVRLSCLFNIVFFHVYDVNFHSLLITDPSLLVLSHTFIIIPNHVIFQCQKILLFCMKIGLWEQKSSSKRAARFISGTRKQFEWKFFNCFFTYYFQCVR